MESKFLRSCIKGYKIKEQPTKEFGEFINQITGIANNINQIARVTNDTGNINNEEVITIFCPPSNCFFLIMMFW